MDDFRADDVRRAREQDPGSKLLLALRLMEEGIALERAKLVARHPSESAEPPTHACGTGCFAVPDSTPLDSLGSVVSVLTREGVRHALVGGLGVSVRGEVRFTGDLDLVVAVDDDARAEALVRRLRAVGWSVVAVVEQAATGRMATVRFELPSGTVTDLIFATTGVEGEIVGAATAVDVPRAGPV